MTLIKHLTESGGGRSFVPLVYAYSTRVSGITQEEFEHSTGRALSLYRSWKFFGLDGVISELSPQVSLEASGVTHNRLISKDGMNNIEPIRLAIDTTRKVSQMVGKEGGEVIGIVHGTNFLAELFSVEIRDISLSMDNLANLSRLYMEAGCSSLLILAGESTPEDIENYTILNNVAELYGCPTSIIFENRSDEGLERMAFRIGFNFIGYTSGDLAQLGPPCLVVHPSNEADVHKQLEKAKSLDSKYPSLIITPRDIPTDLAVDEFLKFVRVIRNYMLS